MPERLLVALDGSRVSESIVSYLERLLRVEDADVTLVTVTSGAGLGENQVAEDYLHKVARRLEAKGVPVDVAVLGGDPAEQILKYAEEGAFTRIALCTRGKTGLARLVLGSVAEQVLRQAKVPVLIVHPYQDTTLNRVVVALDGTHRSARVLEPLTAMALAHGSKVYFVTVVSPTRKDALPVEIAAANLFREQKSLQKAGLDVELAVLFGDPADQILAYARERQAGLVAIASHGRAGLERLRKGSVAESVLRNGTIPLLTLRSADVPISVRAKRMRRRPIRANA